MRRAALFLLLALPLAACKQADPQRTHAYEEMTGQTVLPDSAAANHGEVAVSPGEDYTAEAVAQYDAAGQVPQPNLNTEAMRGLPLPDTATRGWAAKGRDHRQHAEGEHAPAAADGEHAPAAAEPAAH